MHSLGHHSTLIIDCVGWLERVSRHQASFSRPSNRQSFKRVQEANQGAQKPGQRGGLGFGSSGMNLGSFAGDWSQPPSQSSFSQPQANRGGTFPGKKNGGGGFGNGNQQRNKGFVYWSCYYSPVGPRYSNLVLQAVLVLLNEPPLPDHRLLVLATSSNRSFLRELELMDAFGHVIDVPLLSTPEQMLNVISESSVFNSSQLQDIQQRLHTIGQVQKFGIGIKRLLDLVDFARQCDDNYRVSTLVSKLENLALNMY